MDKINNKSRVRLRLSLSGVALVLYLFFFCMRCEYYDSLMSQGGIEASYLIRHTILLLLGLVPIGAQFILALFADFTKNINKRFFATALFVILLIQNWFLLFHAFTSFQPHLSAISKAVFSDSDLIDFAVYVVTFIATVFIPIANSVMVKIYSIALAALNAFSFAYHSVFYIAGETTQWHSVYFALIGVLFSLALYTFSDYLTEDNVFDFVYEVLIYASKPIFGNRYYDKFYSDNEFEDDLNYEFDGVFDSVEGEETSDSDIYEGHCKDYKKLLALAIYEDRNDVLDSATKISDFKDCPEKVGTYGKEELASHFGKILEYCEQVRDRHEGYISDEFFDFMKYLVEEKDSAVFRVDAVLVSEVLNNGYSDPDYLSAVYELEKITSGDNNEKENE